MTAPCQSAIRRRWLDVLCTNIPLTRHRSSHHARLHTSDSRCRAFRSDVPFSHLNRPTSALLSSASRSLQPFSSFTSASTSTSFPSAVDTLEDVLGDSLINWYPGHMHKTFKALDSQIKLCNVVIELPFSSANPKLDQVIGQKRRIIVFNKADLTPQDTQQRVSDFYEQRGQPCLFTQGQHSVSVKRLLPMIEAQCSRKFGTIPLNVLVVGYPNVGKSSIINNLRSISLRRSGPATAPIPGYTRHIRGFLVSQSPPLLMLDTPGVMQPSFTRTLQGQHSALKLAMVRAFKDTIVTHQLLARYLLYTLNQHTPPHLPHYHSPTLAGLHRMNDVSELVRWAVGRVDGRVGLVDGTSETGRQGESVEERAVQWLLRKFRQGELGQFMLDDVDDEIARLKADDAERAERLRANRERKRYEASADGARKVRIITINDEANNTDNTDR